MDIRRLSEEVPDLIIRKRFDEAETRLLEAYREGSEQKERRTLECVLPLLVHLYCSLEPPNVGKAEAFSAEREHLDPSAYNSLQTAMVLYYVAHDYPRTATKLRDTIRKGREENDSATVYSSLSLLGLTCLDLEQPLDAIDVLTELERIALEGVRFVSGDETLFLERMQSRKLELAAVQRIASVVVRYCRDQEFANRLNALSAGNGEQG